MGTILSKEWVKNGRPKEIFTGYGAVVGSMWIELYVDTIRKTLLGTETVTDLNFKTTTSIIIGY